MMGGGGLKERERERERFPVYLGAQRPPVSRGIWSQDCEGKKIER